MRHTKGKWIVSTSGNKQFNKCVIAEDGGSICHISNWYEAEANALLISKAPEMFEALKEAEKILIEVHQYGLIGGLKDGYISTMESIQSLLKELEA